MITAYLRTLMVVGFFSYALNTHLPRAHGSADITALSFCDPPSVAGPSRRGGATDPFLLTTSSDGTAKLWAIKSALVALEMENGECRSDFEIDTSVPTSRSNLR